MNLFKDQYQDNAKVVDGKLILSLPNALTPVVWQMNLNEAKASALEVNDNQKDGFVLVMKTPDGKTVQIAPFENKEQAVRSLMAASKALAGAKGQIYTQPANTGKSSAQAQPIIVNTHNKSGLLKKLGFVALCILILFVMLNYMASLSPHTPQSMQPMSLDRSASAPENNTAGVPMSADEFLKKR